MDLAAHIGGLVMGVGGPWFAKMENVEQLQTGSNFHPTFIWKMLVPLGGTLAVSAPQGEGSILYPLNTHYTRCIWG